MVKAHPSEVDSPIPVVNVHEEEDNPGLQVAANVLRGLLEARTRQGVELLTLTMIFSPT